MAKARVLASLLEKDLADPKEAAQAAFIRIFYLFYKELSNVIDGKLELRKVEELRQRNGESGGQTFHRGQGRVPSSPFDFPDILQGQPGELGQFFLGHVPAAPDSANFLPEKFLNSAHFLPLNKDRREKLAL
ncbi:hypothetical protein JCM15519_24380 [Fundidesulfovibrio butyratiphilus]